MTDCMACAFEAVIRDLEHKPYTKTTIRQLRSRVEHLEHSPFDRDREDRLKWAASFRAVPRVQRAP